MKIASLCSSVAVLAAAASLLACGGATEGTPGGNGNGNRSDDGTGDPTTPSAASSSTDGMQQGPSAGASQREAVIGKECARPTAVLVADHGVIHRPAGKAMRLQLVYQGAAIGVYSVNGANMTLQANNASLHAGATAGYWVETRSATSSLYQRTFFDPTTQEAPGAPDGGGFSNSTIDRCVAKYISADVPNDAAATELIVYGSPYGTTDGAVELARFTVK